MTTTSPGACLSKYTYPSGSIEHTHVTRNAPRAGILERPPHVGYDLDLPRAAGKLQHVGNRLTFTWAMPLAPLERPVAETPWIWVERGPVVWLIDIWWDKQQLTPMQAMRLYVDTALDLGILTEGEDCVFYRNYGRYGWGVARRRLTRPSSRDSVPLKLERVG